jgi:choline-sulfatase
LAATFLGLAGAQPLPVCDGVDLRAEQGEQSGERSIISLLGDLKGDAPSAMIRRGSWKLVDHAGYDEVQLFNLADDPFELVDLGADRANTETRDALRDELRRRWDPDRVTRIVNLNARHLEVFREFVKATEPEMPEYYKPSAAENRLLRR